MQPTTERYLDIARQGRNRWWHYALGILTIVVLWVLLGSLPYLLLGGPEVLLDGAARLSPLLDFIALNLSVIAMVAGLAVAAKLIHRRTLLSLVTPDFHFDWGRVARGGAVWIVVAASFSVLEHVLFPGRYHLSFGAERFLPFLPLVLVLTPLQAATEELAFRGYMMQALGLLTRRPAVIAIASSLPFAALHLANPEIERHGAVLMAANYFAISMLLATIALRDGRLELAIGLHAANNMFSALIVNNYGSAFTTEPIFISELDPVFALVALLFGGLVFHRWIFGRAWPAASARRSQSSDVQ